jgi:hypothetical protein
MAIATNLNFTRSIFLASWNKLRSCRSNFDAEVFDILLWPVFYEKLKTLWNSVKILYLFACNGKYLLQTQFRIWYLYRNLSFYFPLGINIGKIIQFSCLWHLKKGRPSLCLTPTCKEHMSAVVYLVEALWHKPEGRGFETRRGNWTLSIYLILLTALGPGAYSASNKNEYQKQKKIFRESRTRLGA